MKKILILLLVTLLVAACSAAPSPASTASSVSKVPSSSSSQPPVAEPPVSSSTLASSSSTPVSDGPVGIKGSHITDIMLGLEQNGPKIPKPEMKRSKDTSISSHYCDAVQKIDELGITFDYSLSAAQDFSLISGMFGITATTTTGQEDLVELAKGYLGFCATMPCDAVSDNLARFWLENTIDTMDKWGDGTSIIFEDACYEIKWATDEAGVPTSFWLNISCVEPAE